MDQVMECRCGQRFRVADEHLGRAVACPRCSARCETSRPAAAPAGGPARRRRGALGPVLGLAMTLGSASLGLILLAGDGTGGELAGRLLRRDDGSADRVAMLLDRGRAALEDGQFDRAIAAFLGARDLCRADDPRRDEAVAGADRASSARRSAFGETMAAGREAMLARRFDEAEAAFEAARALFEADVAAEELSLADAALAELKERRSSSDRVLDLIRVAAEARDRGDFPGALVALDKGLSLAPEDPEATRLRVEIVAQRDRRVDELIARARCAADKQDWPEVISAAGAAIAAGSTDDRVASLLVSARRNRAGELLHQGRDALANGRDLDALRLGSRAAELAPDSAEVAGLRAEAIYRVGSAEAEGALLGADYRPALEAAEAALAARPGDSTAEALREEARIALEHDERRRMLAPTGPVVDLAFDPDRGQLLALGGDGVVTAWDLAHSPGSPPAFATAPPDGAGPFFDAALAPDGRRVAWAGESGAVVVRMLDHDGPARLDTIADVGARVVAFGPLGRTLAAGTADGRVVAWSIEPGRVERFRVQAGATDRPVTVLAIAHDGKRLAVGFDRGNVYVYDMDRDDSRRILDSLLVEQEHAVTSLAFSPDDLTVAAARDSGHLTAWDVATRKVGERSRPHRAAVSSARFSGDGFHFVSASADGTIHHVSHTDGRADRRLVRSGLALHRVPITALAIDPTANLLATADRDGVVKLWPLTGRGKR